ncbi:unnamed protein product [Closterium sp. Naga37s-1]|nr:unnamed protein product [Closterium sp. Naga37s-1]
MPGKDVDVPAAEPMETSSAGAGSGAQEARKGKKKKKAQQGEGGSGSLPPHLEELRSRVICDMDAPKQTHALQYSGAFAALGVDNSMTLERFRRELTVEIVSQSADGHDLVFDLVGIDAALANAFRRILIAEVPTMAIEKVLMANNTSLVQDEVLSHRLGLVPIAVDPRLFDFPSEDGMASESNTIVFKLDYKCTRNPPADGSRHGTVQSKHLLWQPNGSTYPPDRPTKFTSFGRPQSELHDFATRPPAPTYPDITLARLRPGQAIELEAHAVKGIGRTHAKWSPVATASYRMLPEVVFRKAVEGEMAEQLVAKCPMNVFDIEDMGNGIQRATAPRARNCTVCRECIREEGWGDYIQLRRKRDHFIFSVESTGALPPSVLFTEAVKLLEQKARRLATETDRL